MNLLLTKVHLYDLGVPVFGRLLCRVFCLLSILKNLRKYRCTKRVTVVLGLLSPRDLDQKYLFRHKAFSFHLSSIDDRNNFLTTLMLYINIQIRQKKRTLFFVNPSFKNHDFATCFHLSSHKLVASRLQVGRKFSK